MNKTGVLFTPNTKAGRTQVNVRLEGQRIVLTELNSGEQIQSFGLSELQLEIGGANNHLFFFRHKDDHKQCFYLERDSEVKKWIHENGHDQWRTELQVHHRKGLKVNAFIFLILGLMTISTYQLISSRAAIVKHLAGRIPYEYEQKIGTKLKSLLIPENKIVKNHEASKILDQMLAPLIETLPEGFKSMDIMIANDMAVNAFSAPGGLIVFNKGLILKAKSDAELLAVAAHEFAHVTKRHVLRQLVQTAGVFTLVQLVLGDFSGIIAIVSDQGMYLLTRGFSREMEYEADQEAFGHLVSSRLDPRGLIDFFKQLAILHDHKTSSKAAQGLEFVSTHPLTDKRIDRVKSMYEALDPRTKKKLQYSNQYLKSLQQTLK